MTETFLLAVRAVVYYFSLTLYEISSPYWYPSMVFFDENNYVRPGYTVTFRREF